MANDAIVQLIIGKGVKNVDLSMFSEESRKEVLQQVAEILLRQGKTAEVLEILEFIDLKRYAAMVRPLADQCVDSEDYRTAALIYEKIGDKELSRFIIKNFVEN